MGGVFVKQSTVVVVVIFFLLSISLTSRIFFVAI